MADFPCWNPNCDSCIWVLITANDLSEDHKCVSQDVSSVWAAKISGDSSYRVALVRLRFGDRYNCMRRVSSLIPVEIARYFSLVTGAAILGAVVFNLLPEILSGSLELEVVG